MRSIRSLVFLLLKKNLLRNSTPNIFIIKGGMNMLRYVTNTQCIISKIYAGTRIYWSIINSDSACLSIQREWLDVPVSLFFISRVHTLCQGVASIKTQTLPTLYVMGQQRSFSPTGLGLFKVGHLRQTSENTETTITRAISWDFKKRKGNLINIYPISNSKNICIFCKWSVFDKFIQFC